MTAQLENSMNEITVTSGRNMAHIDPYLTIWGWEIPVYLFLGGMVSGILFFSALYYIRGKSKEMSTVVRITPLFAPILLSIGLFVLFLDLEYKIHVLRFYTAIRLESPMSWGSWTLAVIFPLSIVWALLHAETAFPRFAIRNRLVISILSPFRKNMMVTAWFVMVFSVVLGMYTGILLSAFNARPLWNSAILGPLFLVSGLSSGVALSLLLSKNDHERHILSKIDIMAIAVELFLIIHLIMGLAASTKAHIDAVQMFLGGPFTAEFWVLLIGLGLLLPALIEIFHIRGKSIPVAIPAILVLIGGLAMRFIFVEAGQMNGWLF